MDEAYSALVKPTQDKLAVRQLPAISCSSPLNYYQPLEAKNYSSDDEESKSPKAAEKDDDCSSISFRSETGEDDLKDGEGSDLFSFPQDGPIPNTDVASQFGDPDFTVWDFHPDEPTTPATFSFSTSVESLRSIINVFLKKRLKEPILQNTRKLILSVNRSEHLTYDDELRKRYSS